VKPIVFTIGRQAAAVWCMVFPPVFKFLHELSPKERAGPRAVRVASNRALRYGPPRRTRSSAG
jgi:hypothetical protein